MSVIQPVILSGGAGTRLWPASRAMYPKQLLPLVSARTMLQETALRVCGKENIARDVLIVCNDAHRFLVAEQMLEIGVAARIVLEPEGRNTAPAVALAAMLALKDHDGGADAPLLLIMPDSGDSVQFSKAGIMEIATCFVLNKCDLAGADATEAQLVDTVGDDRPVWKVSTVRDQGIDAVADWLLALDG